MVHPFLTPHANLSPTRHWGASNWPTKPGIVTHCLCSSFFQENGPRPSLKVPGVFFWGRRVALPRCPPSSFSLGAHRLHFFPDARRLHFFQTPLLFLGAYRLHFFFLKWLKGMVACTITGVVLGLNASFSGFWHRERPSPSPPGGRPSFQPQKKIYIYISF